MINIVQIQDLIYQGNFDTALDSIRTLDQKDFFQGEILRSKIYREKRNSEQSLTILQNLENLSELKLSNFEKVTLIIEKGWINFQLKNFDKTLDFITIAKEILSNGIKHPLVGELLLLESSYFGNFEEYEKIIPNLRKAINIFEEFNEFYLLALSFFELASSLRWVLDFEKVTKAVFDAMKIFQNLSLKKKVGEYYLLLCYIHVYSGQTDLCLKSGKQAIEIFNDIKDDRRKYNTECWIAYANFNKGNIIKAEEYLSNAKNYLETVSNTGNSTLIQTFISDEFLFHYLQGRLNLLKGDYSKSYEYFEKCFSVSHSLGRLEFYTFTIAGYLVQVLLELKDHEKLSKYLGVMEKILKNQNPNFWKFFQNPLYNYVKALFLNTKQRRKSKTEAQQLIDEVIKDKMDN